MSNPPHDAPWTDQDTRRPWPRHGGRQASSANTPKKQALRLAVFNHFIDHTAQNLPASAVHVWCTMWRHAGPDNTLTATQGQIAQWIGVPLDRAGESATVKRAIRALKAAGVLAYVGHPGKLGTPSVFRLRTPKRSSGQK